MTPTFTQNERTGECFVSRALFLGKTQVIKGKTSPFFQSEAETSSVLFSGTIPWRIVKVAYYETSTVTKPRDIQAETQILLVDGRAAIESKLKQDEKMLRVWNISKLLDKNIEISIYYEIEVELSRGLD